MPDSKGASPTHEEPAIEQAGAGAEAEEVRTNPTDSMYSPSAETVSPFLYSLFPPQTTTRSPSPSKLEGAQPPAELAEAADAAPPAAAAAAAPEGGRGRRARAARGAPAAASDPPAVRACDGCSGA